MAGGFTNYLENAVLRHLFDQAPFAIPTLYVGLFSSAPSDAGGGNEFPFADGYARVLTDASDWNLSDDGLIINYSAIVFPMVEDDWGTATHWGLFDSTEGGNLLVYGTLTPNEQMQFADVARFASYQLEITLD